MSNTRQDHLLFSDPLQAEMATRHWHNSGQGNHECKMVGGPEKAFVLYDKLGKLFPFFHPALNMDMMTAVAEGKMTKISESPCLSHLTNSSNCLFLDSLH